MASVSQCPACLRARRLSTPQRAAFFGPQELSNDLVSFARGGMISVPLLRIMLEELGYRWTDLWS